MVCWFIGVTKPTSNFVSNGNSQCRTLYVNIGVMVDCPIKLTFYVARHGWASIAKSQNVPLPVISEALGHDSEDTTRIYLALLDSSVVDKANSKVIKSIG